MIYELCRALLKAGWPLDAIEESDYEHLIKIVFGKKKQKVTDLMDYMKREKGLTMS